MKIKNSFVLSIVTLLLLALPATALAAPNTSPLSTSAQAGVNSTYLANLGSSGSGTSTGTSTSSGPAFSSSAQTGTQKLVRDKVFINLEKSYLVIDKGLPVKVEAVISGWLPDPCHILKVAVKPATIGNTINIDVYSLFDPTQACVTVLQPFTTTVSLGAYGKGVYTVVVNGVKLGSFGSSGNITISSNTSAITFDSTLSKAAKTFFSAR